MKQCIHAQSFSVMFPEWDKNCSLPGCSIHVMLQARILGWLAISSCRGYSWPWNWTPVSCVSCTGRKILNHFVTREAQGCNDLYIFIARTCFSSVQSLSRVRLFATPWTAARQDSLSLTNSQSLPKPMSIESVMPSNHLILCSPHLLLPSIFSNIKVFSNESALRIRWPEYWSFSFNISMLSCVRFLATPWIVAFQARLSMGFPRQEYWNGLPFLPPRDLPNPRTKPEYLGLLLSRWILYHCAPWEAQMKQNPFPNACFANTGEHQKWSFPNLYLKIFKMILVFIWSNSNIHKETGNSCLIVVQSLNHVRLFATPWAASCHAPPFSTISQSLLTFISSLPWFIHSIFLCNIVLHSIRLYLHHQTHPQLSIISALAQPLPSFWSC